VFPVTPVITASALPPGRAPPDGARIMCAMLASALAGSATMRGATQARVTDSAAGCKVERNEFRGLTFGRSAPGPWHELCLRPRSSAIYGSSLAHPDCRSREAVTRAQRRATRARRQGIGLKRAQTSLAGWAPGRITCVSGVARRSLSNVICASGYASIDEARGRASIDEGSVRLSLQAGGPGFVGRVLETEARGRQTPSPGTGPRSDAKHRREGGRAMSCRGEPSVDAHAPVSARRAAPDSYNRSVCHSSRSY
jgi:hypothetical protein